MKNRIEIDSRKIGEDKPPFIIAEIGINHEGDFSKAKRMVKDAYESGVECVKFQMHVVENEMVKNDIVPENADETIWEMMKRCSLTYEQHKELKEYTEELGMIYLCTPFSREAVDRLKEMGVSAFKIGSGECNNSPLVSHIAEYGKPVILSTGMNDLDDISKSVKILENHDVDYSLLHCTSLYPTPYEKVRLGAMEDLADNFPNAVIGLSDHSLGIYTALGAVALEASIIEKHFTSDKSWSGPDIPVSIDPQELQELIKGSKAIYEALGGEKKMLPEEEKTSDFAFASVVSIRPIEKGERFTKENIWVKRPGTGKIGAKNFNELLGKKADKDIEEDTQLSWDMIKDE